MFDLRHFFVGFLYMRAVAGFFAMTSRGDEPSKASFACLWTGTLGAVFAAGTGWLYAHHDPLGPSVESDLFWHRWVGVSTAMTENVAASTTVS